MVSLAYMLEVCR